MNIYVEHDAAALARLSSAQRPSCDTIFVRHGDVSDILAATHLANPLSDQWLIDADTPGQRMVTWSGTLADDLFESDPRTWGPPGRKAFASFCDEMAGQLRAHDRRLCFHPHARHVLNDVPSCLTFLRDRAAQPFEVALAPASMLEPSMLDRLEEHLQRQFEGLGQTCAMVILSDVRIVVSPDAEPRCEPVPLGEGLLPRDHVRSLMCSCVLPATPIVIDGRGGGKLIAQQIAWLSD